MKPTRILVVPTTPLGYEGITNVIFNYYKYLDKSRFQFDFAISSGSMEWVQEKIISYGGKIYNLPSRNRNPLRYLLKLRKILLENQYRIVHVHGNSGTMALDIYAAKLANVPIRIAHSHNSTNKYKTIHKLLKPLLNKNLTHAIACSDIAGKWAFTKEYSVLNNGIELEKFKYDPKTRVEYRHKLGLEGCFVIGHIGHMTYQKNHEFLIDIFYNIYKLNPNARLLLVGDGKNRLDIERKVEELSLTNVVTLMGRRNDVNSILQAIDVFVLPSRYEGLGIVNIEAQASGLKCVVADTVPPEAKASENIEFLSLNAPMKVWVKSILKYSKGYNRRDLTEVIRNNGFDIRNVIKELESIYTNKK